MRQLRLSLAFLEETIPLVSDFVVLVNVAVGSHGATFPVALGKLPGSQDLDLFVIAPSDSSFWRLSSPKTHPERHAPYLSWKRKQGNLYNNHVMGIPYLATGNKTLVMILQPCYWYLAKPLED